LTKNNSYTERINNSQSPILIYLPDHTSVILKNGSSLKYPKTFSGSKREVFLTGEAFFEVHKNSKQPFFVHTEEMITRVVGTSFTIKAYKEDQDFNVQVNTGKVYVYANPNNGDQNNSAKIKPVILVPNEQVTYHRKHPGLTKDTLDKPAPLCKSVTKHLFNFKGTLVTNVFQVLIKAYKVPIVYDEAAFSTCKLTAKLDDEPLYEKLNIICKAIDANFSIVNGQPVINGKGCGAENRNDLNQ
jgi:transmembrane sensor